MRGVDNYPAPSVSSSGVEARARPLASRTITLAINEMVNLSQLLYAPAIPSVTEQLVHSTLTRHSALIRLHTIRSNLSLNSITAYTRTLMGRAFEELVEHARP